MQMRDDKSRELASRGYWKLMLLKAMLLKLMLLR